MSVVEVALKQDAYADTDVTNVHERWMMPDSNKGTGRMEGYLTLVRCY